LSHAEE